MNEPNDPGLRIQQIDKELADLQAEMDRVAAGKDPGSAENRAAFQERLQQLKAERNTLVKQVNQDQKG